MLSWKLSTKFSLFLVLVFLLGSGFTIFTLSKHLNHQAEQAVTERAEILVSALQAARNYTQNHIQPVLEAGHTNPQTGDFFPESIPNFAAQTIFANFKEQAPEFQDFSYKEATPNPTNPSDRVDDFEAQVFTQLQLMDPANADPLSGYRTKDNKKLFYIARPLIMNDASCLACHGNAQQAPVGLVEMYGDQNGFGWQLNELVATQMIYVPADQIFERGRQNLWTVSKIFLSTFTALFIIINLLLWRTVTRPLALLTQVAKQISNRSTRSDLGSDAGTGAATDSGTGIQLHTLAPLIVRKDEPGQLARAFEYMVYVLSQREQDLQQAVQERTRSLKLEMHERQTAQDALQTYNHAINHDLRNLVMGISMLVQSVLRRPPKASQETVEMAPTALTMIQKSCDRQLNLMNSLVEVRSSEIWRTVLRPQTIQLGAIAQELQDTYQAKLLGTPHTLNNHIPTTLPAIQADPSQLKRVFENLINNAIKYNPDGVTVKIKAEIVAVTNNNGMKIRCTVSDDGIGIKTTEQQDLFKIHARGQVDRKILGDGLGLYICRKIVAAHGGNIGIESSSTRGAVVWFTLPVSLPV